MKGHTASRALLTRAHVPATGSLLDPRVEEVSWVAWQLASASPHRLSSQQHLNAATSVFDRITEDAWLPGRVSLVSQVEVGGDRHRALRITFGVGFFGAAGTTSDEADALAAQIEARLNASSLPFLVRAIDPSELLDLTDEEVVHGALIRQRYRQLTLEESDDELSVLSRWNPVMDPWSSIARLLLSRTAPTRVRASVVPAELPLESRLELEQTIARATEMRERVERRPDLLTDVDRAITTLVDLQSSYRSPVLCAELAVSSSAPLPEVFIRGLGSSFTSETDVLRRDGRTDVATQTLLLGGFEVDRSPVGLPAAHCDGLPLHGGCQAGELRDLLTLHESPLGWPLPLGGPIPTLPATSFAELPTPPGFDEGVRIGLGAFDEVVRLAADDRRRHVFSVGVPGAGKTTVLVALAVDDLRVGRGFAYLDPHGQAAQRLVAHAAACGTDVAILDPNDPDTYRLELVPRLRADHANLDEVEQAAADLAEAIASTLSDPSFAGPLWERSTRALIVATAVHGVELAEGIAWFDDNTVLRQAATHEAMPAWARDTLLGIVATRDTDGPRLRDWVVSKLTAFTATNVRRIIAAPGEGIDAGMLLESDTPLIVDLSSLARYDVSLVGNLIISSMLRAGFARTSPVDEPYTLIIDEAHRYHAAGMARVNAEGRKFALSLAIATQSLGQLTPDLADAMSGAAIHVAFRQTPDSAARLGQLMAVPPTHLTDLPNLHAYVHVAGRGTCSVAIDPYADLPEQPDEVTNTRQAQRNDRQAARPTAAVDPSAGDTPPTLPGPGSFYAGWVAHRLGRPAG